MQSNKYISQILIVLLFFVSCTGRKTPLEYALCMAEDNRAELEKVLSYYKDDPEKYAAAVFLIENMPAHISYRDDEIDKYYDIAHELLKTDLSHVIIRDSLLNVKKNIYPDLDKKNISNGKQHSEKNHVCTYRSGCASCRRPCIHLVSENHPGKRTHNR